MKKITTVTLNPAIDQTVSIPNFAAGKVNRVQKSQSDPGGKGVNVASNLADFGLKTAVTGFLGKENTGIFERLFAKKGIEDHFVRIEGVTRTGIKVVNDVNQETTDINFPGETPTTADIEALLEIVGRLTAESDWFVLAGSIPAGCRTDIYGDLVRLIKEKGRSVALDTSGEGLKLALPALPSLVKPNIHELEELVGQALETQEEVIEAARRWLATGMETVVVSMGADGAIFVEADEVIRVKPPKVTVKSTVGAGDAMVSGTVAGKVQGASLAECAVLATAFSAAAISQVGSGLPSLAVIESFKNEVIVEHIRRNVGG